MKGKKSMGEKGFTLVEIAIVMVIIGLLLGGIMKGQSLIQQARVKNIINQVDGIRAGVMGFFDRYGMFPGDENLGAVGAIPNGDNANGNGNGQINTGAESFQVFNDLQKAGFIAGSYNGTSDLPRHAFGDQILLYWVNPVGLGLTNHWYRLDNLPWEVAFEIDTKLDDGVFNTGSVVANEDYVPASANIGQFFILL